MFSHSRRYHNECIQTTCRRKLRLGSSQSRRFVRNSTIVSAPSGGSIESCAIHLSEFGEKNKKLEEEFGPQATLEGLDEEPRPEDDEESENEEAQEAKNAALLKKYEMNRMKYYFAVVEFDSAASAEHVYNECEGCEFEHSSNVFDLQFIPSEMSFGARPIRDKATGLDFDDYKPPEFQSKALQQTKFTSSWDDNEDLNRKTLSSWGKGSNKGNLTDATLQAFIASSDDEESEEEDDDAAKRAAQRAKMRQLLGLGASAPANQPKQPAATTLHSQEAKSDDVLEEDTFFVDALERKSSTGKVRKAPHEAEVPSKKKKKKKRRRKKGKDDHADTDAFKVQVDDKRFEALYTAPEFQLDRTNPNFKASESTKIIEKERRRRRGHE